MPIWRDPLDELIADLEPSTAAAPNPAFEMPPPMEDYSITVMSVLSKDPAERQRLAAHPAVKRVMEYHDRLKRKWHSSGPVKPTD
jgi:hypothetical protein